MTRDDCLFCRIVSGVIPTELVAESEHTVAFRDVNPAAPVHILIVPKRHEPNIAALAATSTADLADVFALIAQVAQEEGIAENHRLVFNTGRDGGQTIFHVHGHLLGGKVFTEG